MADNATCRLYLVTPPRIEPTAFVENLKAAFGAGDVACLQLRLKDDSDDDIRRTTELLLPITQAADVAFIMNDRPDLAAELGCDGVHVGQEDSPYTEAREIVGGDAIVGVTCHNSRHLAMEAASSGANYVAFGAFFSTDTKDAKTSADIETLEWWAEMMTVPCVAIGGIMPQNCAPLVKAGADFLSIISGVWDHPDGPAAAVAEFIGVIARVDAL